MVLNDLELVLNQSDDNGLQLMIKQGGAFLSMAQLYSDTTRNGLMGLFKCSSLICNLSGC